MSNEKLIYTKTEQIRPNTQNEYDRDNTNAKEPNKRRIQFLQNSSPIY